MGKSSRGSRCCHRWHSGGEKEKERGRDGRCLSSPLSLRLWTGFVFHSLMQVRKGNSLTCMRGRDGPERSRATNHLPTMRRSVMTQGGNLPEHGSCSSTLRTDSAALFIKPDMNYREWVNERPDVTSLLLAERFKDLLQHWNSSENSWSVLVIVIYHISPSNSCSCISKNSRQKGHFQTITMLIAILNSIIMRLDVNLRRF